MSSPNPLNNEPKLNRYPAVLTTADYLARIKDPVTQANKRALDDLIYCYRVDDHFAVRVFRGNDSRHDPQLNTRRKQP